MTQEQDKLDIQIVKVCPIVQMVKVCPIIQMVKVRPIIQMVKVYPIGACAVFKACVIGLLCLVM